MDGVGDRLKEAMKVHSMSANRLAGLTRVHRSTVGDYLAGKSSPTAIWIVDAATMLGVRAEWLLTGRGEMNERVQRVRERRENHERLTAKVLNHLRVSEGFTSPPAYGGGETVAPWAYPLFDLMLRRWNRYGSPLAPHAEAGLSPAVASTPRYTAFEDSFVDIIASPLHAIGLGWDDPGRRPGNETAVNAAGRPALVEIEKLRMARFPSRKAIYIRLATELIPRGRNLSP